MTILQANSLCMIADFKNDFICLIFFVFWIGFFPQSNSKWFVGRILTSFFEFKYLTQKEDFPNSLCMMADFQNGLISRIFVCFKAVFRKEQLHMICKMDFDMFFGILIFDPRWEFCKGYSLCIMADFQNGLISPIFGVYWTGFLQTIALNDL